MITRLLIAYDGTDFSGWQVQPNGISIQQKLEEALHILLREQVRVVGAGRTDAGVHAVGQVAHFRHAQALDYRRLHASLNALLPVTIRVRTIAEAPDGFHAQFSATSKIYHYHLGLGHVINPFRRLYRVQFYQTLDLSKLAAATQYFVGTRDFTSFANSSHEGCAARDAVRTLNRLDLIEEEDGFRLEFEADGFLYKMVRNIVGTLLEIGTGKRALEDIPSLFEAHDRRAVGMAAPAHGLFLIQVHYANF